MGVKNDEGNKERLLSAKLVHPMPSDLTNPINNLTHIKKPQSNSVYLNRLNVWYTNADSLTQSKLSEIECRITMEHPDVICITESNPKNYVYELTDAQFNISGYDMIRTSAGTGRGVIIYTANHLLASKIEVQTKFEESLWCNINIDKKHNIIVGGVYRSPHSTEQNNHLLMDLLKEVQKIKHDHIIVAGDFNLKEIDWKLREVHGSPNSYQYKMFDTVNDLFFHEIIKENTRFRGSDEPSALDWILTENENCILSKKVDAPLGRSDHALISIEYDCIVEKADEDEVRFSYYNGDYNAIREDLGNIDWQSELCDLNTQQQWDKIHSKLIGLIERHIPKKKYTNSNKPPWWRRELNGLKKLMSQTFNRYKKDPTPENFMEKNKKRNKYNHTIDEAKTFYENKIASEVKTNPKQFWKYINKRTKSKGKIVDLLNEKGDLISDDLQKAEILNNQFASVFTKENLSIIPEPQNMNETENILEDIVIETEAISKHLKKLNISKASGPDGINARILNELADEIAPALKILFDSSMKEGALPYQWKEANVIALFKKGSKRSPNNYRPVSLTAICCKINEKIIRDAIVDCLEPNGLINVNQHGFRSGRSCCTQLLEVMEMWTRWHDRGIPWDAVYTDFSKAFDSVPHERLLLKLNAIGIRGKVLQWIKSFLSDRKQRVILGKEKSGWLSVTSGIPQGSVLGPILFTIFINDMPDVVKSSIKLFADDTKIFKAIESVEDISTIQEDINNLQQWSNIWQLPFNIDKCKVLHFGKNNQKHVYSMGTNDLACDEKEKDVGVLFDTTFNFKSHIKCMVAKANSRVGIIKRSFSRLNIQSFKLLYKSLVRPILEYCSAIWFPLQKCDILEIEKVQRRATKLIPKLKDKSYPERLKALNLPTLIYRRNRTDILQVFRIFNKIDNIDPNMFFTLNNSNTRGHKWKLEKPRANTSIRANSFSNRVINDWNALPESVVECSTINAFKNELETAWKNNPKKYDPDG